MKKIHIYRNLLTILSLDVLLLCVVYFMSYYLRFDFGLHRQYQAKIIATLPLVIAVKIGCFYFCNLYRGMWRFTSIRDVVNIVKAAVISTFLIVGSLLIYNRFDGFPRSVFAIDLCLTILVISALRLLVRIYFEHYGSSVVLADDECPKPRKLLIIGAGAMGEKIFRLINDNAMRKYSVVGFLDDHPVKIGKMIHGVKVLGKISDINFIAERMNADEALIAIPSASASQMREIVSHCERCGITYKTLPNMGEMINGNVSVGSIRDVAYIDLLGRKDIKLDEDKIDKYIENRVVLVTGAGGSIGSELCRQICRFKPKQVLLFERAESPLYEIDLELRNHYTDVNVVPLLADIQNMTQLDQVFNNYRPEIVFHAAAYKHVPMLE